MKSIFPNKQEFENLLNVDQMDGRFGIYRAPQKDCVIDAHTDWEAIQAWLSNKFKSKPNTLRQYRTQSERLLLWAIIEKNKSISSLTLQDFEDYFRFLDNPYPYQKWCMQKGRGNIERWQPGWRPFTGPLSASAKATAVHAINTMLNYWREFGYLKLNVLNMIDLSEYKKPGEINQLLVAERALSKEEWQAVMQALKSMPEKTKAQQHEKARTGFMFFTLLITACRRQELVDMRWHHIGQHRGIWRLQLVGKGDKPALLVLPDEFIAFANEYRAVFQFPSLKTEFAENEETPVFFNMRSYAVISSDHVNTIVKNICLLARNFIDDENSKERLGQATAHWIRHTAATVLDGLGVNKDIIKKHLRHDNAATTELYVHKNSELVQGSLSGLVSEMLIVN